MLTQTLSKRGLIPRANNTAAHVGQFLLRMLWSSCSFLHRVHFALLHEWMHLCHSISHDARLGSQCLSCHRTLEEYYSFLAIFQFLSFQFEQLQSERNNFETRVGEMEIQIDEISLKYETQVKSLKEELASVYEQLRHLSDAKLSMELEIACYKKLLETEESRSVRWAWYLGTGLRMKDISKCKI